MEYVSTRNNASRVTAAQAIIQGISPESGLFVPVSLPALSLSQINGLADKNYIDRATDILKEFLGDFTAAEIHDCVVKAYGTGRFSGCDIAPIAKLSANLYMLELWHGPTCAFKDMALQLLPHLLTLSMKKTGGHKHICILTATSGDTGKAALEGFSDIDGVSIFAFYPHGGVSPVQYLQMATQEGANVGVCGVRGNFDDTQTGVKKIFTDPSAKAELADKNIVLSSANSINWGRLVPQIVYYVSAYCDLIKAGEIYLGEKINICVPTGNFGNILAAYYAKCMGLPVGRLICASNKNNVLSDFISTGTYDRRRELHLTVSPSMDILVSSNLERLLYALHGNNSETVSTLMRSLEAHGMYKIDNDVKERLHLDFYGGYCGESDTLAAVKSTYDKYSYLCDTHTAVALAVYDKYVCQTGDTCKTILASTANPYKFAAPILAALSGQKTDCDDFASIDALHNLTGVNIPPQISGLRDKTVRFDMVRDVAEMYSALSDWLADTV